MKLDAWREMRKLKQTELARMLDLTDSSVSRILKTSRRPDWPTMDRIVAVTDGAVTPNDFMDASPESEDASNG